MQEEDLRKLSRDLEETVVSRILATRNNETTNGTSSASACPTGLWELHILRHLIACCAPGVQEPVNEDGAGDSGSEFEYSAGLEPDEHEYDVIMNPSKGREIRKTNQSSGKVSLCFVGSV